MDNANDSFIGCERARVMMQCENDSPNYRQKKERVSCMKIDLSSVNIFEDNELESDKKITFIFGKNGTGKSTITEEIKKLNSNYEVSIFQGFNNIIDENHRLNAVVLSEENLLINAQIEQRKKEIELKHQLSKI